MSENIEEDRSSGDAPREAVTKENQFTADIALPSFSNRLPSQSDSGTVPKAEGPEGQATSAPGRQEALAFIWETVKVVVISLAVIIPVRYFLVQPFFVKGASMEPTFDDGNYILIDEISYRFRDPQRGDIVVFRYPLDKSQFFIKRVVGLPGETLEVKDNKIITYSQENPKGFVLDENTYLAPDQRTLGNFKVKIDPDEYFVLGDNRARSSDSRVWGAVNRSLITGRVFFRALPLKGFGTFPEVNY